MSVVQGAGAMAYNPAAFANMNLNGQMQTYPASSGNVKVDQIKPLVLGKLNSFSCK